MLDDATVVVALSSDARRTTPNRHKKYAIPQYRGILSRWKYIRSSNDACNMLIAALRIGVNFYKADRLEPPPHFSNS